MSQDRTDTRQGCALTKHCCGRGVPEDVSAVDRRFDAGPKQSGADDVRDRCTCQRMNRSQDSCEHRGNLQRWPARLYIELVLFFASHMLVESSSKLYRKEKYTISLVVVKSLRYNEECPL